MARNQTSFSNINRIIFLLVGFLCLSICGKGQAPYCTSFAGSDGMYDITKVDFFQGASNVFSNSSACGTLTTGPGSWLGRYSNYRNLTVSLPKGQTFTLNVTHDACTGTFNTPTILVMYLDLNKNYVFDTPSERLIWSSPITVMVGGTITLTGTFTIPSTVTIDTTLMRIITASNNFWFPYACSSTNNYIRGETEDYTVTFCEPVNRNRTITLPLCNGQTNGKIKIAASGGRAPLQYAWNGGSYGSVDSLMSIGAGTYTLITRDSLGCKHFDTIIVSQPSPLVLNKQLDKSCQNANTGRIVLTGSGGRPSYRYRLGSSGSYDTVRHFTNLARGSYIVSVRDSNLCVKTDTVLVDSFPFYPLVKEVDTIVCRSKGGSIRLRYQDIFDQTKYTHYSYNGGAFTPLWMGMYDANYTLDSGRHIVVMRDLNGCLIADTTHLSAPPPTKLSLIGMNHLGCNGMKGRIQVQRTGGNPALNYNYYWSHIGTTTSKDSFHNLDTGLYTIEVRDDRFCDTTKLKIRINNISARIKPSYQMLTPYKCPSDTQHIVKLSAAGGAAPYQYSIFSLDFPEWNYKIYTFPPYGFKDTIHVSSANTYKTLHVYVKTKDTNQCENDTFFLIRPESICYANATALPNPSCVGDTIEIQMSYNLGDELYIKSPVRYSVQGLPFTTSKTLKPVKAIQGTNLITIQHGQGCVDYTNVFISTNPAVTMTTIPTHPSCIGLNNGSIRGFVLSGTGPYIYRLNGGIGQSSPIFNALAAGSYTVQVVDDKGCKSSEQVVLNPPDYLLRAELISPISCKNQADGTLRVTLSGTGIQPGVQYSINGSSPSTQNTWSGLAAGSYTIRMTYNTSCSYDTTILLTEPSLLRANYLANQTALPCYGSQLGSIQVVPSGGSPSYNLTVNGTSIPIQTLFGLGAGSYFLELRDSRGCIDTQTFVFTAPERLSIDTSLVIQPACNASNSGRIAVQSSGGTLPHTIVWSTGETALDRSGLSAGLYSIRIIDKNLCSDSIKVVLNEPSGIQILSSVENVSCFGYNDGKINISSNGGAMPHSYLWNDGLTIGSRINLKPGNYQMSVTDDKNCQRSESFSIREPARISSQITVNDATCPYTTDGSIKLIPSGGTVLSSLDYKVKLDNGTSEKKNIFEFLAPKLYQIKILDNRDCYLDTQALVSSPPIVKISIDSIHQLTSIGESITLQPRLEPSLATVSLQWYPSSGLSCTDCMNPVFNGFITQAYTLAYRYQNNLCGDSVKTLVRVPLADPTTIYIPTAFSPNGEGDPENETFKVYGLHILGIDMKVYNRWGEKVYETDDKEKGWNGLYRSEPAPKGIYTYTLHIRLLDGTKVVKNGEVMLTR